MKTKAFFNKIFCVAAALVLSLFCVFESVFIKQVKVEADEVVYTDVLADLQKDSSFNVEDYPAKATDSSLQVIQIAESVNDELFIYVYQPCHDTKDLVASSIRLSMPAVNELSDYKDYSLCLLSTKGVFDKYKVVGLTLKTTAVRYYDIVQLMRPFDAAIDKQADFDNTINGIPCKVAQQWVAQTVDEKVFYSFSTIEVLEVTDKYVGYLRYWEGFKLFEANKCDSHFVAFSVDRPIDKLLAASLSFSAYTYEDKAEPGGSVSVGGDTYYKDNLLLTYDESVSTSAGLFGKTYKWTRIETVKSFLEKEDLTDTAKEALKNKTFVLRFLETDFIDEDYGNLMYYHHKYTRVESVSILSLTFEVEGKTYKMGVVDNAQTGSSTPSNPQIEDELNKFIDKFWSTFTDFFSDMFGWVIGVALLVLGVIAVAIFAPWVFGLVGKGFLAACKFALKILRVGLKWGWKIIIFIICWPWNILFRLNKKKK